MKIAVTMIETVVHDTEYTLEEFAEMVGCEPTVEAVRAAIDEGYDTALGVEGAVDLLDDLLLADTDPSEGGRTRYIGVTNREWEFSVKED